MLGRLVTHWADIVGADMAAQAQPVKIRYFKAKKEGDKPTAALDIAATSADATVLMYRKDLILERINQIFGERLIGAIRFVPVAANSQPPSRHGFGKRKTLTEDEKTYLSGVLETVGDEALAEKLRQLGSAILKDRP